MENKTELWNLFTAREEYNSTLKDKFNRSPYWASKNRNVFTPTVSEYLLKNGLKIHYPDNKKFALCLTHDIDYLYSDTLTLNRYIKKGARNLLSLNLKELTKHVNQGFKRKINPNFNISVTLKHEKKYNARSTCYFLSLSSEEEDFNYDLSEITEIFDQILQSNGEIGLHGGHLAYNNISKIKQEKEKLEAAIGKTVHGYRNHFLRFETPTTWDYLDKLNFKYDTTYGYADSVGFRNGMCHPFNPYNLNNNTFLDIIELPLVIMECSLWSYMRLNEKDQFELCKKIINTVAENNGVLTLLWHNTEMQGYAGQLYNTILKYAHEIGAWMPTSSEMVDYWKENKYDTAIKTLLEQLRSA